VARAYRVCLSSSRFYRHISLMARVRPLVHIPSSPPIFLLITTPFKDFPHVLTQPLESTPSPRQLFFNVSRSSQQDIRWGGVQAMGTKPSRKRFDRIHRLSGRGMPLCLTSSLPAEAVVDSGRSRPCKSCVPGVPV